MVISIFFGWRFPFRMLVVEHVSPLSDRHHQSSQALSGAKSRSSQQPPATHPATYVKRTSEIIPNMVEKQKYEL